MDFSLDSELGSDYTYDLPKRTELTIRYTDMGERMKERIISVGQRALARFQTEIDIATYVKDYLDKTYKGGRWHVFVGKNMRSSCQHELGKFMHFFIGGVAFIVFRTKSST